MIDAPNKLPQRLRLSLLFWLHNLLLLVLLIAFAARAPASSSPVATGPAAEFNTHQATPNTGLPQPPLSD